MDNIILRAKNLWSIEDVVEDGVVRCFLVAGDERAVLIDTGNALGDLTETVKALTSLPVTLLVSHGDRDHIGGNAFFADRMAHPDEFPLLAQNTPGLRYMPLPDVIELGGRTLEVIHIPGHTPGSVAFFDREAGILLPGDSASEATIFEFGPHRALLPFIVSQARLAALGDAVKTIMPCHGPCPIAPDGIFEALALAAWRVLAGEKSPEVCHMAFPGEEFDVFVHRCGRGSIFTSV